MRLFCRILPFVCLCLLACSARATQITIQDPSADALVPFTVFPITTPTFTVVFTDTCQSAIGTNDDGCFSFTDRTGFDWTSITLTTTLASPDGSYTCASPDVFHSCSYDPATGLYTLVFTQGTVTGTPSPHSYYTISEDDIDSSLLTFQATVTYATTPEPSGLILLGTGLLGVGVLVRARRRIWA